MGDPSKDFRARGALFECFIDFLQFKEDPGVLIAPQGM
jgi:hypothetical protein